LPVTPPRPVLLQACPDPIHWAPSTPTNRKVYRSGALGRAPEHNIMSDRKLQVVPLGGLGEFGMNIMALRYGDDIMVIDCGMMFPEAELLGVDIVTPDLTYLVEHREQVRALFLTHGHEDHIGAVPYFLAEFDVPIYGTPFTLALV